MILWILTLLKCAHKLKYCIPNFSPQETLCWTLTVDCSHAVMPGTVSWMLIPYSAQRLFQPKVLHVWWCKFLHAEVPGNLIGRDYNMEEITGLKLWHVIGRFLRDEENVVVIFYWNTMNILYYTTLYRRNLQYWIICYFQDEGRRGETVGQGTRQRQMYSCQHIWNHNTVGKMKHHANCSMSFI